MITANEFSAVILAGGESRRMGQDKAWLEIHRQPLIVRALSTVRDSGIDEIFISGRAGTDYSGLGYPVLLDGRSGCGPLSGIERALGAATAPLVMVLAVDLPKMTGAFLSKLAGYCDGPTGAVPKLKGQLEPLAAIYPKLCHSIVSDCLLKGRHGARHFAEVCLRAGALKAVPVSPADAACFDNWNRPEDIAHHHWQVTSQPETANFPIEIRINRTE